MKWTERGPKWKKAVKACMACLECEGTADDARKASRLPLRSSGYYAPLLAPQSISTAG
nr:hypothetical protein [Mesorhizobium sp.]